MQLKWSKSAMCSGPRAPCKGALLCAVKGAGSQQEKDPPGNWVAPAGSNRSGGGGNATVGAWATMAGRRPMNGPPKPLPQSAATPVSKEALKRLDRMRNNF